MPSAKAPEKLDAYLQEVRANLRGLPSAEVSEILMELRSHVLDFAAGDLSDARIAEALEKLGAPREIARLNMSMRVAAQSLDHRGLVAVGGTLLRLARLSVRGLVALIISIMGYGLALSWLITALAKPFAPDHVGLWLVPEKGGELAVSLGAHSGTVAGHDLLGWWVVPIGIVLGIGIGYLTYRYDLSAIRRMAQGRLRAANA